MFRIELVSSDLGRLFAGGFPLSQDGLDSCNQPVLLAKLTRSVEPFRLRLDPQSEQMLLGLGQRDLELFVAHFPKLGSNHVSLPDLLLVSFLRHLREKLPRAAVYKGRRFTNRTRTGILCASRLKHNRAASSDDPPISYNTVPGFTTAAQ
jgi:hypothetical protein